VKTAQLFQPAQDFQKLVEQFKIADQETVQSVGSVAGEEPRAASKLVHLELPAKLRDGFEDAE
jgi:hypothetical protein